MPTDQDPTPTTPTPAPDDQNQSQSQPQPTDTRAAYLAAVRELAAAGETDDLEGGVAASQVARHVGVADTTAYKHLAALVDAGQLRLVEGIDPDTRRRRSSYLPADDTTGDPDE